MENYPALFKYDAAMNNAIIKQAIDDHVTLENFTKIAAHISGATKTWLYRLQGSKGDAPAVWPEQSLREIMPSLEKVYKELDSFLSSKEFSDSTEIAYTNSAGKKFTNTATEILTHLLLHNSYHRGQLNLLLRQIGTEPVPQDYILFTR